MAKQKVGSRRSRREAAGQREARWRKVLTEWGQSGLTQVAFCEERGLPVERLRWWKRDLARRDAERAALQKPKGRGEALRSGKAVFLPVRVAGARAAPRDAHGGVEVVLVSGRRVRVGSDVNAELLTKVVTVLEGVPW